MTLGDLRSWAGSTHSCLQEAIHPRAGGRSDVCGNLRHMGRNVETARPSFNQNGAFCLCRVQHRLWVTLAEFIMLSQCSYNTLIFQCKLLTHLVSVRNAAANPNQTFLLKYLFSSSFNSNHIFLFSSLNEIYSHSVMCRPITGF